MTSSDPGLNQSQLTFIVKEDLSNIGHGILTSSENLNVRNCLCEFLARRTFQLIIRVAQ